MVQVHVSHHDCHQSQTASFFISQTDVCDSLSDSLSSRVRGHSILRERGRRSSRGWEGGGGVAVVRGVMSYTAQINSFDHIQRLWQPAMQSPKQTPPQPFSIAEPRSPLLGPVDWVGDAAASLLGAHHTFCTYVAFFTLKCLERVR